MAQERPIWSVDGQTLSNVLIKGTNITGTYNVVTTWYDGTPMDDTKLDSDLVYVKYEGKYLLRNFEYGQVLQKDAMADMRALSTLEILLLRLGVYKHVQLNGYYEKGDTPTPIEYKLSTTTDVDDGGSVIEVGDVKLEHTFTSKSINVSYYGVKYNDILFSEQNCDVLSIILSKNLQLDVSDIVHLLSNKDQPVVDNVIINGVNNKASLVIDNTSTHFVFNPSFLESDIIIKNIKISTEGSNFVRLMQKLSDITINTLNASNLEISGNICIFRLNGQDNLLSHIKSINIYNNKISNSSEQTFRLLSISYSKFSIFDNIVKNHSEVPFYIAVNSYTNAQEISNRRVGLDIYGNFMENDEDVVSESGGYHCFALVEGKEVKYHNNIVKGLKSIIVASVYDVYCSCEEVDYYSNINENNLCLVSNTTNTFFKLKSGANARCYNNRFIASEEYIDNMVNIHGVNKENCSTRTFTASATGDPGNIEYYNNSLEAYYIDNTIATAYLMRNVMKNDNKIVCSKLKGTLLPVSNRLESESENKFLELSRNYVDVIMKHELGNAIISGVENESPETYIPNVSIKANGNTFKNISGAFFAGSAGLKVTNVEISDNNITAGDTTAFRFFNSVNILNTLTGGSNIVEIAKIGGSEWTGSSNVNNIDFDKTLIYKGFNNGAGFGLEIYNDTINNRTYNRFIEFTSKGNTININPFVETYVNAGSCIVKYMDYTTGTTHEIPYTGGVLGNGSAYHVIFDQLGLRLFMRVRSGGNIVIGYFSTETELDYKIKIKDNVK